MDKVQKAKDDIAQEASAAARAELIQAELVERDRGQALPPEHPEHCHGARCYRDIVQCNRLRNKLGLAPA